jgi:cytochrome c peroxidase
MGLGIAAPARAQNGGQGWQPYAPGGNGMPNWANAAAALASQTPFLPFFGVQSTPSIIPVFQLVPNLSGASATYQPGGPTVTANNAFFAASLGTNGRTCASCHAASAGWSITPPQVQALFWRTQGTDPLFQPVDGANCPDVNLSTLPAQLSGYSLLLGKGLIRIFEKAAQPPVAQYSVVAVQDPTACNTDPAYGLGTGFLSVFRRPLPSVDLGVLSTILADGREPSLEQQAIDATRIHAQATPAQVAALTLTSTPITQMVSFELGITAAQTFAFTAGDLTSGGAAGGPVPLATLPFQLGINDALAGNPNEMPPDPIANPAPFNPNVYSLYSGLAPGLSGYGWGWGWAAQARASIARGENIFNTRNFTISGVTGFNDMLGQAAITGTCSTCHDTPNAGSNSNFLMVDTGTTTPGAPGLDQSGLPVFTLQSNAGPLTGETVTTTDPGRAILSGQCSDVNRLKVPTLRNLAARPPYFHNGSAANLASVVNFYNSRFSIGLSGQDTQDLVNFLNAL